MDSSFRWNDGVAVEFTSNNHEYSVSEIAARVKRVVEDNFGHVRVRGELSKVTVNVASGHAYITMKDEKSVLDAACWKGTLARLKHRPEAGMEVIATGKLTTYPGRSTYQLVIESMEPAGVGALMALLEQRKKQLAAEGLFDLARKKPIPYLPDTIGIITSPTGAVIRDILHRLSDRFPRHVLLWPVAVQGQDAAAQVAAAIQGFNAMPNGPDVIIVARGGGSIEDLWAFNEEIVVRAAAASRIPLISAVGHETDTTLIDYASDKRAPTPTGAAEFAVPVREELLHTVEDIAVRMNAAVRTRLAHARDKVEHLARGLPRPQQLVAMMAQGLDEVSERLALALPRMLVLKVERLHSVVARLSPRFLILQWQRQSERLKGLAALLESLNVDSVLKRGFAIVRDGAGNLVTAAALVPITGTLSLTFHDGEKKVALAGAKTKQASLFEES